MKHTLSALLAAAAIALLPTWAHADSSTESTISTTPGTSQATRVAIDFALTSSLQRIAAASSTGGATFASDGFNPGVLVQAHYKLSEGYEAGAIAGISRLGFNSTSSSDALISSSTARWEIGLQGAKKLSDDFMVHLDGILDKRAFAWRSAASTVTLDLLAIPEVGAGLKYRVIDASWGTIGTGFDMRYLLGSTSQNYRVSGGWLARLSVDYGHLLEEVPCSVQIYLERSHQNTSLYVGDAWETGLSLNASFDILGG